MVLTGRSRPDWANLASINSHFQPRYNTRQKLMLIWADMSEAGRCGASNWAWAKLSPVRENCLPGQVSGAMRASRPSSAFTVPSAVLRLSILAISRVIAIAAHFHRAGKLQIALSCKRGVAAAKINYQRACLAFIVTQTGKRGHAGGVVNPMSGGSVMRRRKRFSQLARCKDSCPYFITRLWPCMPSGFSTVMLLSITKS